MHFPRDWLEFHPCQRFFLRGGILNIGSGQRNEIMLELSVKILPQIPSPYTQLLARVAQLCGSKNSMSLPVTDTLPR